MRCDARRRTPGCIRGYDAATRRNFVPQGARGPTVRAKFHHYVPRRAIEACVHAYVPALLLTRAASSIRLRVDSDASRLRVRLYRILYQS